MIGTNLYPGNGDQAIVEPRLSQPCRKRGVRAVSRRDSGGKHILTER